MQSKLKSPAMQSADIRASGGLQKREHVTQREIVPGTMVSCCPFSRFCIFWRKDFYAHPIGSCTHLVRCCSTSPLHWIIGLCMQVLLRRRPFYRADALGCSIGREGRPRLGTLLEDIWDLTGSGRFRILSSPPAHPSQPTCPVQPIHSATAGPSSHLTPTSASPTVPSLAIGPSLVGAAQPATVESTTASASAPSNPPLSVQAGLSSRLSLIEQIRPPSMTLFCHFLLPFLLHSWTPQCANHININFILDAGC